MHLHVTVINMDVKDADNALYATKVTGKLLGA